MLTEFQDKKIKFWPFIRIWVCHIIFNQSIGMIDGSELSFLFWCFPCSPQWHRTKIKISWDITSNVELENKLASLLESVRPSRIFSFSIYINIIYFLFHFKSRSRYTRPYKTSKFELFFESYSISIFCILWLRNLGKTQYIVGVCDGLICDCKICHRVENLQLGRYY